LMLMWYWCQCWRVDVYICWLCWWWWRWCDVNDDVDVMLWCMTLMMTLIMMFVMTLSMIAAKLLVILINSQTFVRHKYRRKGWTPEFKSEVLFSAVQLGFKASSYKALKQT
jgi:hypothetical protein